MISVPSARRRAPLPFSNLNLQTIRQSVLVRLILLVGLRSDIIGLGAPRSSLFGTDIIGRHRDHRYLSTIAVRIHAAPDGVTPLGAEWLGDHRSGLDTGSPMKPLRIKKGSEIIGRFGGLMAGLLIETANTGIVSLQTHKRGTTMATDPALPLSDDLMNSGLDVLHRKSLTILKRIRDSAVDPDTGQKKGPTFPISKAAALVGRTASAVREAERDGRLPARGRTGSGHRLQYTLEELDHMREVFGTRPWRELTDTPAIISVCNFKGGVGKSTIALHLAQHFAIKGYRVLFIDCDSQASSTMMFGYRPDVDLDEEDTLYGHFHNPELLGVRKIIRKTHFHNLHLIPSNLRLYNLEYEIAGYMAKNQNMEIIDLIAQAIDEVVDDYDVVIMDPPPALGMVSMAVLQAANSMVIPVPPSLVDFASTVSFIDMTRTTMKQLEQLAGRGRPAYNFIRLVGSRVDESKSMHREILSMMRQVFGGSMTQSVMVTSAEIDNASSRMKTVFELEKPVTSHEVYNRCMKHLNDVCQDIELDVLRTWASRAGGQI